MYFRPPFTDHFPSFWSRSYFIVGHLKVNSFSFSSSAFSFCSLLKLYCICVNNSRWAMNFLHTWRTSPLCSGDNLAVRLNLYSEWDLCSLSGIWERCRPSSAFCSVFSACVLEVHTDTADQLPNQRQLNGLQMSRENAFIFSPSLLRWSIH